MLSNQISQQTKEPWLAVSLSWLVPGAGQLYAEHVLRGVIFFVLAAIVGIVGIASNVSQTISLIIVHPHIALCGNIALRGIVCLDAFKLTKRYNIKKGHPARTRGKQPWLALLLSFILPGLGHAYMRKWISFTSYLLAFFAFYALSQRLYLLSMLSPLFYVIVCSHAYLAGPDSRRRSSTAILKFGLLILLVGHFNAGVHLLVGKYLFETCRVGSGCMEPTLRKGDRIIVSKRAYLQDNPFPGDIVLYKMPEEYGKRAGDKAVKRVVAVGGETVQVKGDTLFVDGQERKFKIYEDSNARPRRKQHEDDIKKLPLIYIKFGVTEPYVVPENSYFLLGDNPRKSMDGRFSGALPRNRIIGKVVRKI